MILWIIILTSAIVISMFWQPNVSAGYMPEPPRRPCQKEQYISMVWNLIRSEDYLKIKKVLEKPKYSLANLPVESWKVAIYQNKMKKLEDSKKILDIESLEKLLE